jgi:hypothetical protein
MPDSPNTTGIALEKAMLQFHSSSQTIDCQTAASPFKGQF